MGVNFSVDYLAVEMSWVCACAPALPPELSGLIHCETAAVETARVIKITMMAANCANPFANSLISISPL